MSEIRAVAFQAQTNIDVPGFFVSPTGLIINGNPTFDDWDLCGQSLSLIEGAIQWAIGDWLNFGEVTYPEVYAQGIDEDRFKYETLKRYKYVSGAIPLCRRRHKLSHSHHAEVASLDNSDQDYFLDLAEKGDDGRPWSQSKLRNEIRAWSRLKALEAHMPDTIIEDEAIICADCTQVPWPVGIDLIVADPPFGLTSGDSAGVREAKGDWDRKQYEDLHEFNVKWLSLAIDALRDEGSLLVFGTVHNIFSVGHILKELGCYIVRDIVWNKPFVQRQVNLYSLVPSHELIIWARKGERHTCNLAEITRDVWEIQPASKYGHPTEKPETLIEHLVLMASDPGDMVFDPFLGSGTTTAVAKRLKRRYGGIEQDGQWHKIATERTRNSSQL